MSDFDYTPKSNEKFGEKDSVTSCEPIILEIILKTGDVPSCEPMLCRIRRFEKSEKWDSTISPSSSSITTGDK